MSKAILIDVVNRDVREVSVAGLKDIQRFVDGYITTAWSWDNGDVLFVDDEGLFKRHEGYFRWLARTDNQPLAGNGLIVGAEVEDDSEEGYHSEAPAVTVDQVRTMVQWLTPSQAKAWFAGNASEPAVTFTSIGPDGKATGTPEVLMRMRDIEEGL